jgi:hypothetical protein
MSGTWNEGQMRKVLTVIEMRGGADITDVRTM